MFNPHTKFEVSTQLMATPNVKILRFVPPFGGFRGNAQGSSMARWKALTAAALLSEVCRNRRFLMGWVTLSANFR